MKKLLIGLTTLAAIAAPVATVVACGTATSSYSVTSKEQVPAFKGTKITGKSLGAIVSDPENPRWQKAKDYLQKNGVAAGFNTTTNIAKAAADQKTWIAAHLSDIDGLVVGATDDSIAGSWSQWSDNKKPVVAYDRLIKKNDNAYNWYVTYNNSLVGELQAKNILASIYGDKSILKMDKAAIKTFVDAHKLSAKKSIISVGGDPADNNAGLFFHGAADLLQVAITADPNLSWGEEKFSIFKSVAQNGWNYATGQTFLQSEITSMDNKATIAAVLSPNDGMATAAINALKNNALDPKKIYITGQDSNDTAVLSIHNGTGQDMTISKPDSQATAVAVGLEKYLIQHPEANVKPGDAVVGNDIIAAIKADFGDIEMTYDKSSYKVNTSTSINTMLLTPKVVDKDNLDQFFSVNISK